MMGKCYQKIEIEAPINQVWDTISDFHDLSWAPNVVTSVAKIGDINGNEIGAGRILNDVFYETLTALDSRNFTFSYSIDDGPGPVASDAVNDYVGTVKLTASGSGCLVEWSSVFQSQNENAVGDLCNPIYMALLNSLKETLS
jgi:carbon monoxide dehydrogenase subunit G